MMSDGPNSNSSESERRSREPFSRSNLSVPTGRLLLKPRATVSADPKADSTRLRAPRAATSPVGYQAVKAELHTRLLDEFDERNLMAAGEETLAAAVHEF